MSSTGCSVADCASSVHGRQEYCKLHYDRFRRHGDPTVCLKPKAPFGAPMAWLVAHQDSESEGCLTWPFSIYPNGRAHMFRGNPCRIMCEMAHGAPQTPSHQAAHSCGKGHEGCIHPKHLRWATASENELDKTFIGGPKLSRIDVAVIRALKGKARNIDIARTYGISDEHVANIFRGIKWREVTP